MNSVSQFAQQCTLVDERARKHKYHIHKHSKFEAALVTLHHYQRKMSNINDI